MKYKILRDEFTIFGSKTLYRIEAIKDFGDVKKGDKGGLVESEYNLSQEGNCWLYDDAICYDKGRILVDAKVKNYARVFGHALVTGFAEVSEQPWIHENALVGCHAKVQNSSHIQGHSFIGGSALITDEAVIADYALIDDFARVGGQVVVEGSTVICDHAQVLQNAVVGDAATIGGSAIVRGRAIVKGAAKINDNAVIENGIVTGHARIGGHSVIKKTSDYLLIGPIGSRDDFLTVIVPDQQVATGYFYGTLDDLEDKARRVGRKEYLLLIPAIRAIIENRIDMDLLGRY